jgi:outer membrane receptor protein involved in Fe transport
MKATDSPVCRNTAGVWTRYDFQQGPWRGLSLGAGVFAVGEREGDDANTFQLPGYARVDLLAAYDWQYNCQHGLCNAHHLRELTFVHEQMQ